MARYKPRRRATYGRLIAAGFRHFEAHEISKLGGESQALSSLISDREERRARFEKTAATKISQGKWRRSDLTKHWIKNLKDLYRKNHWMVQKTGHRNEPSPWAMYRHYENQFGGPGKKPYTSPWELKQIATGHTRLEKGLIFVQRVERQQGAGRPVNDMQVRQWIEEKNTAIANAKTESRRAQLVIERGRLERLIARRN